jgi:hypothetical protein
MAKDRNYGSGTEKALFMLSRGTCYEPTCKTRVLRMTKTRTPRVNVQIAHVYPLGRGEARYDEAKANDQTFINSFRNLLLLCQPHHTEVDSELWKEHYQAEVLFGWKGQREGGLTTALAELPPLLGDDQFQEILVDAISRMHDEIITAIDNVTGISQETLRLVKELVSESFTRPYLSDDTIASLEYSARVFDGMGDQTLMLYESARGLRGLEDHAWMLRESSLDLRELPDSVGLLLQAANDLKRMSPDVVESLSIAGRDLRELPNFIHSLSTAAQQLEAARLPDIEYSIDHVENAARHLKSATSNAGALEEAAEAMEAAAQSMGFAAQANGLTRRSLVNAFWWGFGVCFVGLAVILGLSTYLVTR